METNKRPLLTIASVVTAIVALVLFFLLGSILGLFRSHDTTGDMHCRAQGFTHRESCESGIVETGIDAACGSIQGWIYIDGVDQGSFPDTSTGENALHFSMSAPYPRDGEAHTVRYVWEYHGPDGGVEDQFSIDSSYLIQPCASQQPPSSIDPTTPEPTDEPSADVGSDGQTIVAIDLEVFTNGYDADEAPGPNILVGGWVAWTYEVRNTGNVPFSNVEVTDNLGAVVTCPGSSLAAGASMTCTANAIAWAGLYANVGTATGTAATGSASDSDPSHFFGVAPGIDIEVTTNGEDADAAPGPYILAGETVDWAYVVTNTGNKPLSNIAVADDQGAVVTCPQGGLSAGASMTCSGSGAAGAGQYANIGTAMGMSVVGAVVDSDPSHYFGAVPGVQIEVSTNGEDADAAPGPYILAGSPVDWAYVVENTGNVTLSDVVVMDDQGVVVSCPGSDLPVGASMTCTAGGAAGAGQYANIGTIEAMTAVGAITDSDPSHYFGAAPGIDIEVSTNGVDADAAPGPYVLVGDAVDWEYLVENTGNLPLSEVAVTDDQGVVVSCPGSDLALGASMTCTASGTAGVGQYANIGTATGMTVVGLATGSDPSHHFGANPDIDIEVFINDDDADTPPGLYIPVGESLTVTFVVTNTGNVPLSDLELTDESVVVAGGIGTASVTSYPLVDSLAVGEVVTISEGPNAVAGGIYSRFVTVTGMSAFGAVSDSDPGYFIGALSRIEIQVYTNGEDADESPGTYILTDAPVVWEYVVENTGTIPLSDVVVTDDQGVAVSCPGSVLDAGASMTCTASGTAGAGQYANLGTVTGMTVIGPATHSDPSHYFGSFPDMDVEVNVNGVDADTPPGLHILVGSSVDVILTVTNTGNVPISAIDGWLSWSVVYPTSGVGSTSLYPIDALAVGEVYTASLYSNSSIANADYWYQVVATGTTPVGTVTDSDQAYFSGAVPGIDIEVHTNGFDADTATGPIITMGDAVSWQYVVENTGEVPLSDVAVTDDQGVTVSCPGSNLTIGASMTCTSSGVAVPGQYANLGTVTANSVLGSVTDSDPSHYLGSSSRIDIELSTNGEDADMAPGPSVEVGDTVIWTYAVTNTGDVPLTGVLVTADVSPPPGCSIDLLPVAATLTCSHSGMVTPGLFEIVGTVTANGDLGLVTDSDPSHHFGIQAGIDIEVHTNGIDADAAPGPYLTPGSAVTWTYIVMNTGSADLSDIVVEDSNGVPVSCPGSSLAPGGSMTCTASGVAGSGQYQTIGTVTATSVVGSVTDSDPSHYFGAAPGIDIEVSTNGHDADVAPGPSIPVGGMITWTYFVENTGDMPLWNVQVTDNQGAVVTCPQSSLQVNATMTCTALDVAGFGQYANTGSVTATWDGGTIGDSDPSHYFGFEASIDIEVHTNGEDADIAPGPTVPPGSGVTWTYLVSNLGNVDLSSIVVSDNMGVAVSCPGSGLMPGQMMTCEASDVAVSGQYGNIGTVSASSLAGPISDSDPSHYYGDPAPEAWEWTCGWYISLYEQGIISYEDIPTWCLPLPY